MVIHFITLHLGWSAGVYSFPRGSKVILVAPAPAAPLSSSVNAWVECPEEGELVSHDFSFVSGAQQPGGGTRHAYSLVVNDGAWHLYVRVPEESPARKVDQTLEEILRDING